MSDFFWFCMRQLVPTKLCFKKIPGRTTGCDPLMDLPPPAYGRAPPQHKCPRCWLFHKPLQTYAGFSFSYTLCLGKNGVELLMVWNFVQ